MENNILLSIAVPTWNRAGFLKNMLNILLPQVEKLKGEIEVCISDNASEDNTSEIVEGFQKKYPGLIKYNKNKENLGFDRNFLSVIKMASGEFVWTFSDDDLMARNALKEVIDFIKKNKEENIGMIFVKTESYYIDEKNKEKIFLSNGLDKNKPDIFKVSKESIISMFFPELSFISALIFNNKFLKILLIEDEEIIKKAVGNLHIHMTLGVLMFLKYNQLQGFVLNKRPFVEQEMSFYKSFIEGRFKLHYLAQIELTKPLLSSEYIKENHKPLIINKISKARKEFILDMLAMKAFKNFNYFSFFSCLKIFFQHANVLDALLFSLLFLIVYITPPFVLIFLYKILLMIKYDKGWKLKWQMTKNLNILIANSSKIREGEISFLKK